MEDNFYIDDGLLSSSDKEEIVRVVKDTQKALHDNGKIRMHKITAIDRCLRNVWQKWLVWISQRDQPIRLFNSITHPFLSWSKMELVNRTLCDWHKHFPNNRTAIYTPRCLVTFKWNLRPSRLYCACHHCRQNNLQRSISWWKVVGCHLTG